MGPHRRVSSVLAPRAEGVLGMCPVAVAEKSRHKGIAERLVRLGIDKARRLGWRGIITLGPPEWYERFGFGEEVLSGIVQQPEGLPRFAGLELVPGGLDVSTPRVSTSVHAPKRG